MKDSELKRWRMILGDNEGFREGRGKGHGFGESVEDCAGEGEGPGEGEGEGEGPELSETEQNIDQALNAIYDDKDSRGDLSKSSPRIAQWLGEVRNYFPNSMVQIIQRDAIKRMNLLQLLGEPEMIDNIVPDVNLVATLLAISKAIPEKNREAARSIVRKVAEQLSMKLYVPLTQAVNGAINRAVKKRNPKFKDIDWNATILKNLKHYQPDYKTVIPETRIGYTHKRRELKDVIICLDQSGSMNTSLVFSGVYASVLSTISSIRTQLVAFDTAVADLTDKLDDPVELLFGLQLGGGTDINKALQYCQRLIERPADTYLIIITDLEEGGNVLQMRRRFLDIKQSGVEVIVLLALNDDGAPRFNHANADFLASLRIPCFACTPDKFPGLMASALNRQDLMEFFYSQE